ncbi:MAG: hypothetical protein JSS76_14530 [Bacteroidetes bacterium]|nr:hypothetical protein [Bacteroidota bacterium]
MALLHDLLSVLNDTHIGELRFLHLTQRERQLLNFCLMKRKSKTFPSAMAMRQLHLTQGHLEKLCSVVMKSIILRLAGPDGYDQFSFIRNLRNRSYTLVTHQMRVSEKKIKAQDALIKFYGECCEVVTRADSRVMKAADIQKYTRRLLSLLDPAAHPEWYIRIQCDALYAAISMGTMDMSLYDARVAQSLSRKVEKLLRDARALQHPMALHHVLRVAAMLYISTDQQLRAAAIMDEDIRITSENRNLFNDKECAEPRLMKAEALSYAGMYEPAYEIFASLITPAESTLSNIRLSSQSRFFKVALTLGKYEMAKAIIDTHFAEAMHGGQTDIRVMAYLQVICYHMHIGALTEAEDHITACRALLHKHQQQQYLLQLLFFENAMVYLKNDAGGAKLLAMKNLKFLRSRKMTRATSTYPALFSSISAVYDLQYRDKRFNKKQQQDFEICTTRSYSHFAGIFRRMLEMKRVKAPPLLYTAEAGTPETTWSGD